MKNQLPRDEKGRFIKGYHYNPKQEFKPGVCSYRHPKGTRASPQTEFKPNRPIIPQKGEKPAYTPLPKIRRRKNGQVEKYVYIRTEQKIPVHYKGYRPFNRSKVISYARYVYEKTFGQGSIPKGYVVYHIDGNPFNNNIGNLKVISRTELVKINHKK